VKAISIVGGIEDEPAILQNNPISRLTCTRIDRHCTNKCNGKESDLVVQVDKSFGCEPATGRYFRHRTN